MVGSKLDLPRRVSKERVEAMLASLQDVMYFEVSSKSGECIEQLFTSVGRHLFEKFR